MKIKNKVVAILICIFIIIFVFYIGKIKNDKNVTIIQLSPQTSSQMMGYIIKTKNNKMIIIDGGIVGDTDNLKKYIQEHNNEVDYWFLTHNHNDHASAFVKIANEENIEIKNVYASLNDKNWYEINEPSRAEFSKVLIDTLNSDKLKNKVKEPKLNEKLKIDGINVEILGIKNPEITENPGNEQSMVIKFDTGSTKFLILGDTGKNSSEKLLKNQKDKLKSDIVQMAHHGQAGATEELYKEINPIICLWPTPKWLWNNDNGGGENSGTWKTMETRSWMENIGVKQNHVAKDGDIAISIK